MQLMKLCTVCGKEFPSTNEYFPKSSTVKCGLRSACKKCTAKANKEKHKMYYAENKEKVNAKNMENYYKKHPKKFIPEGYKKCSKCNELKTLDNFNKSSHTKVGYKPSCKECRKTEYLSNYEYNIKRAKIWYENNKEKAYEHRKVYVKKRIEWYQENNRRYYKENSERMKENSKRSLYKRIESDDGFKILQRLRKRLWDAIKGNVKSARTKELIGCTTEELIKHIENKFTAGMSWDNYGEWHLDHIIPCASFDFSIEENQFKCFNYKNLQPLWAVDNIRKSNKI